MRVRNEHWQIIINLCENNPELVTKKFNGIDGKAKGHALWQTVSHKLNSLGFGEKSVEEWRRALVDWKSKTKAKAVKIKREMGKTGGGPANYLPLSDLENRLIEIMGTKAIDGDQVPELGFGKVTVISSQAEPSISKMENNYCPTFNETVENQCGELNTDSIVTKTKSLKRTFSDSRKQKRRVRPGENERLSAKLIIVNEESLQVLKTISKNTESMADSLKTMTGIIEQHFKNKYL